MTRGHASNTSNEMHHTGGLGARCLLYEDVEHPNQQFRPNQASRHLMHETSDA